MPTESELAGNLRAFQDYNQERIKKAIQISPYSSKLAIHVVPILLEYNHHELPCYVSTEIKPKIIPFFEIGTVQFNAAEDVLKHFKSINSEIQSGSRESIYHSSSKTLIHSLFIMGSIGTVAQNERSDFDYWVVVDESQLEKEELDYLKTKLELLEKWGEKHGSEFHFFITDVNKARANNFGSVDKESAGSSQAKLLKEEFYRTAVLVAGRYPVWWVTPPAMSNEKYEEVMQVISSSYGLDATRFVNLGNIDSIPLREFFGAALWQINKAMDSPFKSVLKMGMLESFITSSKETLLLCDELKGNVFKSGGGKKSPDPYLVLIDRLLDYYYMEKRQDIVDLLCKCFYNKVHIMLTDATNRKKKLSYKEEVMLSYVDEWEWGARDIQDMNSYDDWPFDKMLKLGTQLHNFLLETYKNLTDNLKKRKQYEALISRDDLTVLGRKLFTFYSRKEGKVELVRRASDEALRQESVTFYPIVVRGRKTLWTILRGNMTAQIARNEAVNFAKIKEGKVLAELVIWLLVNRIIDSKSFLHLVPSPLPVSLQQIQELIKSINDFMPYEQISSIESKFLLHHSKVAQLMAITNFVSQSWTKTIDEITLIYRNTHGETFIETSAGKTGVERTMAVFSTAVKDGIENPHTFFRIFMLRAEHSAKLEKQLKAVIFSRLNKPGQQSGS